MKLLGPARSDVLVLAYHAVSPDFTAPLSVTPQALADQLERLSSRGYLGVTFSEAVQGPSSGRVVAVTFDDGYRSVLELGKPVLDRFGMPGTMFVPTGYIGSEQPMSWPGIDHLAEGPQGRELTPMSWAEVRSLLDAGWEIGSHTRSHPHLTEIGDGELEDELSGSRREVEEALGRECTSLAYPYGDWDARVAAAAGAAGYRAAGTLPAAIHPAAPLSFPRIGVYNADDTRSFGVKTSPAIRRLRQTRAWEPLVGIGRRLLRRPAE